MEGKKIKKRKEKKSIHTHVQKSEKKNSVISIGAAGYLNTN